MHPSPTKRQKSSKTHAVDELDLDDISHADKAEHKPDMDDNAEDEIVASEYSSLSSDASDGSGPDTEDEITHVKRQKSRKTQKRKRRATSPSHFGVALQALLNTSASAEPPLTLKPSFTKRRNEEKLEAEAKKLVEGERKEKEEKSHLIDVIGGWGGENERALRKVAQRGVVKLFNAIQQAQQAATAAQEEAKSNRGSGKPTLPAPSIPSKHKNKGKGPQKLSDAPMAQDDFLSIIRSGGIVSRT